MARVFTIGILGGSGEGIRTAQYFGKIADRFLETLPRVRIIIPISNKGERLVALNLLEQRKESPGLEIAVILTAQQWQDYLQNATGDKIDVCNRIITAADRHIVFEKSIERIFNPELYRFYIERCDYIIFNGHRAGDENTIILKRIVREMAVPLCVQYTLRYYLEPDYPFDRGHYRIYESGYYDPYAEISQSITFLRRNNFTLSADHVPHVFVYKWLAVPPAGWYHYLATPDNTFNIFRLRETPRHDYLSLKVFAAAYSVRNNLWATTREFPTGDDAIRRFKQFRQLLEIIATKQDLCEKIEPFDLFDFDRYDAVLKSFAAKVSINRRKELHENPQNSPTEMPKVHEPRKRIQRKRYIPA